MLKNGHNVLKYEHNMYYDYFYQFQKICQNLSNNDDFSAKKLLFFRLGGSIFSV